MPYTKGASNATGPYVVSGTQTYQQANNGEYQYDEATQSFEQHLFTPFVLTGGVATKNGVTATQLDVTAIDAFPQQADNTLRWRHGAATNFSTVGSPSATLFLDLKADGTYNWATTHPAAPYLTIATVTTDAGANISAVTDTRTLNTTLLGGAAGNVALANTQYVNKAGDTMTGGLTVPVITGASGVNNGSQFVAQFTGSAAGDFLKATAALAGTHEFHIGLDSSGNLYIYDATSAAYVYKGTANTVQLPHAIQSLDTFLGIKSNGGTKLAQFGSIPSHGAQDMAIGGTTYWTTQPSSGFNNSASFSSFDVAEVYATDQTYPGGTVVCPQGDVLRACIHESCHAALVVSKAPGYAIGDPVVLAQQGETAELCALVGRVRVMAPGTVMARDLVTPDGKGGVRAMRHGEEGYSLGVALDMAAGGSVGVLLRPMYCVAR